MRKKFIVDISANTLQSGVNQLCGLVIFYILSISLNKEQFGEFNWSLAVLLTSFGILACGIDQVALKKIASGNDSQTVVSTLIMHVLIAGAIFYACLLLSYFLVPTFHQQHNILLFLAIGKLMIFFSTPFKQLSTGLEKYRPLLFMSVCSNVVRAIILLCLTFFYNVSLTYIIITFVVGDCCELILCFLITKQVLKFPLIFYWSKKSYQRLFVESLPQLGVTVMGAIIARFDWIILGIFSTNIILANYSFAYKIFEMATLPLIVIAPLLITRFTKLFQSENTNLTKEKTNDLLVLLKIEIIIASLTALVLNIMWVPVIDLISKGKYGEVNKHTILILSLCMPFLFLNNYLWSINFARGRLKMIFYVFLFTLIANLVGDLILIPMFDAEGAAFGYLLAIVVQSFLYLRQTTLNGLQQHSYKILLIPALAAVAAMLSIHFFVNVWIALLTSTLLYFLMLILTKQFSSKDWSVLKRVTGLKRAT